MFNLFAENNMLAKILNFDWSACSIHSIINLALIEFDRIKNTYFS